MTNIDPKELSAEQLTAVLEVLEEQTEDTDILILLDRLRAHIAHLEQRLAETRSAANLAPQFEATLKSVKAQREAAEQEAERYKKALKAIPALAHFAEPELRQQIEVIVEDALNKK